MSDSGIENAWKIHAAISDWTGKVDTKASFALTLEAAGLSAIVLLTRPQQPLSQISSQLGLATFWLGCILLFSAALAAIAVVMPRIRSDRTAQEWPDNYIYFGHLRHWSSDALADRLQSSKDDILPILSRQLVNMSKIAWRKHRIVQVSLALAMLGGFLVTTGGLVG
ncbi:Pycsar system effector family protein [Pseudonocardia sp. HH130630-07]|uniref:Pycsar system effector family protein n=1 Tax=Pseudonocardia sp. HH130630-07 TaxID=1690815 RepID=UPI0009F6FCF5